MDKNIQYYLQGVGLDTSRERQLEGARHWFIEPDNFYRFLPENGFQPESFDYIFNKGLINETKFHKILIKEWFGMVKPGGHIVVQFSPNDILNFAEFVDEVRLLTLNKGDILYQNIKEGEGIFILKKNQSVLLRNDSMDQWTFGIITVGQRNDWVENIIQRIRSFRIPKYEIIICGKYYDRRENDIVYIHFEEKDDLGWITKKKNLICEAANYENIYITNDRILPNEDWFEGMKKYGNYFESLSCVQVLNSGQRVGDWMTFGTECKKSKNTPFKLGLLDYQDWDDWSYGVGSLNILKKSVWQKSKWDENLFWVDSVEDGVFCHQLMKKGYLTRFNPYATTLSLAWRHGKLPFYKFHKSRLGKRRGVPVRRFGWVCLRAMGRLGIQGPVAHFVSKILKKLKLYDFIVKH